MLGLKLFNNIFIVLRSIFSPVLVSLAPPCAAGALVLECTDCFREICLMNVSNIGNFEYILPAAKLALFFFLAINSVADLLKTSSLTLMKAKLTF